MRRIAPAIALYFLAPFVAEFLLGDFPLTLIFLILPLSTMYGGGALLIRELVRRTGRGWPTIVLLALAFGVIEEGLLTQSLFNPDYLDAHLLDDGFVPSLGIAIPWTIFVLTIHTIWSISTPIAVVEEASGPRRTQPWLGVPGFIAACSLFLAGSAFTFGVSYQDGHFMASPPQLAASFLAAVVLIVVAFRLPRRVAPAPATFGPWVVFFVTMGTGIVLFAQELMPIWAGVTLVVVVLALIVVFIARWSWGPRHRFALGSASLLTYAWHSFFQQPVEGSQATLNLVTHIVFTLVALVIIWYAHRRILSHTNTSVALPSNVTVHAG